MLRNNTFWRKHVSLKFLEDSLSYLLFSLMFSQGELKSLYFLHVLSGRSQVSLFLTSVVSSGIDRCTCNSSYHTIKATTAHIAYQR